jgi:hypothetical protein
MYKKAHPSEQLLVVDSLMYADNPNIILGVFLN